ncbi:hypothetical protein [Pontimicrobium aquaticum]|uniref:Uncharacterized protein n=1 Tax=Pontimicrobium aquaticum TaxID=2565367 RepID=A0A4U0EVL5_9FLAO|nr:hypothetical protein [Pontimicrobium aquaticum]TJY35893.1 hypothetical protein E5167_08475 [Pontimicrobium aquaticum]
MLIKEFNNLEYEEKLFCVVDNGTFVDNYITNEVRINCYSLFNFFVELEYDPIENKIVNVKSFNSGAELDKYVPKSNIF